jgi:chemotaxis protein CheD
MTKQVSAFNVNIGEVRLGSASDQLVTVLGSCVALILWHPHHRLGIMGHVLMPSRPRFSTVNEGLDGRYADECWQIMQHKLEDLGIAPGECRYHLVGGAQVFDKPLLNIGSLNVSRILGLLGKSGLTADTTHTGARGSRMLSFHMETGEVMVKHHLKSVTLS